jgi:hypothetical protein
MKSVETLLFHVKKSQQMLRDRGTRPFSE